jgi:hypothetical protein
MTNGQFKSINSGIFYGSGCNHPAVHQNQRAVKQKEENQGSKRREQAEI